jgi:hypothetical protein
MKAKTLTEFTKAVNALAQKDAAKSTGIFKGVHYDFPERMLEHYWNDGYTPRQVLNQIQAEAEAENAAEARMS